MTQHDIFYWFQWQKHTWIDLLYFPGWHTTAHTVFSVALHKSSYTCLQLKRPRAICGFSSRNLWIDLREAGSDNKSEQREGHRGFRCVRLWFSVESARGGLKSSGLSFTMSTSSSGWNACSTLPWPRECVSESSGLINNWGEPRDKQGHIPGGLIFCWLASGMSFTLVSLVDS